MITCLGHKLNGEPCSRRVRLPNLYCHSHRRNNEPPIEPIEVCEHIHSEHIEHGKLEPKKEKQKEEETCCICCEIMDENEKPLPCCGQRIHKACLIKSGREKCPLCRNPKAIQLLNKTERKQLTKSYKELLGYHNRNTEEGLISGITRHIHAFSNQNEIHMCQDGLSTARRSLARIQLVIHRQHAVLEHILFHTPETVQDVLQKIHILEQQEMQINDEIVCWKMMLRDLHGEEASSSSS